MVNSILRLLCLLAASFRARRSPLPSMFIEVVEDWIQRYYRPKTRTRPAACMQCGSSSGIPQLYFVSCSLKITLKFVLQNYKHQHQYQKTTVLISNPIHKKVQKKQINNFSLHAISQISGFKGSPHSTDPEVASHVEPPRHGTLNTWRPREFMEVYPPGPQDAIVTNEGLGLDSVLKFME